MDRKSADGRVVRQVGMLAAILVLELVLFRAWLPQPPTEHANNLLALLTERGPGTLRFVVVQFAMAFVMLSLIFGESRFASLRTLFSGHLGEPERWITWAPFLAHSLMVLVFGGLTTVALGMTLWSAPGAAVAATWLASGAMAVGFLAVAFMPVAFWTLLFRSTRQVLAFALLVAVGAYAFGRLALIVWQPLSRATMAVAYAMLHPIVSALTSDPSTFTMGTPDFRVQIQAQCSGYEGLGLMLVFTTAWLWFHRAEWRFPHALILVPMGLAGVWILNCVRVAGLILIGIAGAPAVAVGGFHSQAGWLAFNAIALGTCLAARRVTWLQRHPTDQSSSHSHTINPTLPYLLPFLAVLAGSMVAQLASAGFEWLYAARVALGAAVVCYFVPRYRSLNWRIGWSSIALGCGIFVIWIGLDALLGSGSPAGMPLPLKEAPAAWQTAWIVLRVLGAVAVVPIAEELAFRGFLLRRIDSEDFQSVRWEAVSWMGILLSSVAFGLLHGDRWLAGTVAGVLYALIYARRGSIGDAVAAHATTNALIAAEVLIAGHWQLW